MSGRPLRIALAIDPPEEDWASMDLYASMVGDALRAHHRDAVEAVDLVPHLPRRLSRWSKSLGAWRADRIVGRHWDVPRWLKGRLRRERFDLVHVMDHSYAQLALVADAMGLPVVSSCHDLGAFRCLHDPKGDPRPAWFRALARRTLRGLQKARRVVCISAATRDELIERRYVPPERLVASHLGTHPECSPLPDLLADRRLASLLGDVPEGPALMHAGTNVARKRIDVVLRVLGSLGPGAWLIKMGGDLDPTQWALARELGVADRVRVLPRFDTSLTVDRATMAAAYRRADLVVLPSEMEGFGLPMAEALACGTAVLASDLKVFREVGADVCDYAPVGDFDAWTHAARRAMARPRDEGEPPRIKRAAQLSWAAHAEALVKAYRSALE